MFMRRSQRGSGGCNIVPGALDELRRVVAPYAGAWIEMFDGITGVPVQQSRSLRGSVD